MHVEPLIAHILLTIGHFEMDESTSEDAWFELETRLKLFMTKDSGLFEAAK